MNARMALPILILAALAAMSLPSPAASGPWGLPPGEWHSSLEGNLFSSTSSYDIDGARVVTGRVVEQRGLASVTEIGWKKRTTVLFALPVLSVTKRDPGVQGTATGFQDARVGVRYNLANGGTALALEAEWSAPAGYNRHLDSLGLQLGDGLQQLSAGIAVGSGLFGRGFIQGSLGYGHRYLAIGKRNSGPVVAGDPHTAKYVWADRLLASADLGLWVGPSLLVGGRYRGSLAQATGPMVAETDAQLAGPILLYRVDAGLDMVAGSWSTIAGTNSLRYHQFYVGMAFHKTTLNRLQGFLGSKEAP